LNFKISLRTTQKNAEHNTRVRNTPTLMRGEPTPSLLWLLWILVKFVFFEEMVKHNKKWCLDMCWLLRNCFCGYFWHVSMILAHFRSKIGQKSHIFKFFRNFQKNEVFISTCGYPRGYFHKSISRKQVDNGQLAYICFSWSHRGHWEIWTFSGFFSVFLSFVWWFFARRTSFRPAQNFQKHHWLTKNQQKTSMNQLWFLVT